MLTVTLGREREEEKGSEELVNNRGVTCTCTAIIAT